jgi:hypothetical protein
MVYMKRDSDYEGIRQEQGKVKRQKVKGEMKKQTQLAGRCPEARSTKLQIPDQSGWSLQTQFEKTKPISRPSAGSSKREARNPKHGDSTEPELKKQSQSPAFGRKCEARIPKSETEGTEETKPIYFVLSAG